MMFYVDGEDGWERYCREGALAQKGTEFLEEVMTTTEINVDYTRLVLANIDLNSK